MAFLPRPADRSHTRSRTPEAAIIGDLAPRRQTRSAPPIRYSAFISYSHAADRRLAEALQGALHQFAKPFYRLRAMRVFRDDASLGVSPHLWPDLQRALADSEHFVLLASPDAAGSEWVEKEVNEWFALGRSPETFLIVLTDGALRWDHGAGDFDLRPRETTALPPALRGRFTHEPLYLDLRWARAATDLSLQNARFVHAVAGLAARIRGQPKDMLVGEDVAEHQKFRRAAAAVIALLLVLLLGAGMLAALASRQAAVARSRELAARAAAAMRDGDGEAALELALEGARRSRTAEALQTLRQALASSPIVATIGPHWHDLSRGFVAFSPDGAHIVTADKESYRVWRASSRAPVLIATRQEGIESANFSDDGSHLVTFGHDSIRVWSTRSWAQVSQMPTTFATSSFGSMDPGHRLLLTADPFDATTRLWNLPSGTLVRSFTTWLTSEAVFADSGRLIVTADIDGPNRPADGRGRVHVWDAATGSKKFSRPASVDALRRNGLSVSPDGMWIATRTLGDTVVEVWHAKSGETLHRLRGPGPFWSASFSPRARQIVTADRSTAVRVWNAITGAQEQVLTAPADVSGAVFSPDGSRVVAVGGDHIHVWNLSDSRFLGTVFLRESQAAMSPDASRFVVARGRSARLVRPAGAPDARGITGADTTVAVLRGTTADASPEWSAWSADGHFLATVRGPSVDVWEPRARRLVGRLAGHTGTVRSVRFNPRAPWELATTAEDSTVRVWSVDGRELRRYREPADHIATGAEYSGDGRWLIVGAHRSAILLDQAALRPVWRWSAGSSNVTAASFVPGTRRLLIAIFTGSRIVDPWTDSVLVQVPGNGGAALLGGDGRRILGGPAPVRFQTSSSFFRLYDARSGALMGFRRHRWSRPRSEKAEHAAFSPSGRLLVTVGEYPDGRVRVWDASSGRLVSTLPEEYIGVEDLELTPDDRLLLVSSGGNSLTVWTPRSGERAAAFGVPGAILHATFSPDGRFLALTCDDDAVRVYPRPMMASSSEVVAQAMDMAWGSAAP